MLRTYCNVSRDFITYILIDRALCKYLYTSDDIQGILAIYVRALYSLKCALIELPLIRQWYPKNFPDNFRDIVSKGQHTIHTFNVASSIIFQAYLSSISLIDIVDTAN